MFDEMAISIVEARHLDVDDVKDWRWSRFVHTFRQCGRSQWDRWIAQAQAAEVGTVRAIATAFGSKHLKPYPDYDDVKQDVWEQRPQKQLSPRMQQYLIANGLER